ncbi:ABC transporter permease [Fibrobacter sp. UBA3629]|uniref:ABC transporter permease n=1 Tax=Fibrobacter sp. UBA3629 TaxID=1946530 RepID=UPI0025BF2930|nr:ABC transporter permease [Fibrobacter sp. UBA3629]
MILNGLLNTIRKIYFSHNIVLWMTLVVLPIGVSLFTIGMFSSQIVQHVPIGIVKQDDSQLADKLEMKLRSSPVLDIKMICTDMSECEHAVVRGDLQGFLVFPNDLERRALRLEAPVIPVYSSGQNYLTNMFATKEIRSVLASAGSELFTAQMEDPVKVQIHSVGNLKSNYQGFLAFGLVIAIFHLAAMIVGVYVVSFPLRDHRVTEMIRYAGGSRLTLWVASVIPMNIVLWLETVGCYAYCHRLLAPLTFDEFVMSAAAQLFMIFACSGAGTVFVGVFGIMRMATGAAGIIGSPAFAFAGQTFPVMAMPFAVRCFAFILPLTHVLMIQSTMLLGDVDMASAWESMKILIGMAVFWNVLGALLMSMRWKQHLRREAKMKEVKNAEAQA